MTYEILAHPADVKFRTHGKTLEDAFSEVVPAVSDLVGGADESRQRTVTRDIELGARNLEALLFDFLNQLILFQDIEGAVVTQAADLHIGQTETGWQISATVQAVPIPPNQSRLDIKAPTYSEMRVEQTDGWTIEAVLDV